MIRAMPYVQKHIRNLVQKNTHTKYAGKSHDKYGLRKSKVVYLLGLPTFWREPPSFWSIPWWRCLRPPTSWCWQHIPCQPGSSKNRFYESSFCIVYLSVSCHLLSWGIAIVQHCLDCFRLCLPVFHLFKGFCMVFWIWWRAGMPAVPRQTFSFLPQGFQHSSSQPSPSPLTCRPSGA